MWQRFTEHARHAILLAQQEGNLRQQNVEPLHLLLGVLRETKSSGAQILREIGVEEAAVLALLPAKIEAKTAKSLWGKPVAAARFEPKLAESGKRVLRDAAEQSKQLGHSSVGTEHLLLALLAHDTSLAAQALKSAGLTLQSLRKRVGTEAQREFIHNAPAVILDEETRELLARAGRKLAPHQSVGLENWLAELLCDAAHPLVALLEANGLNREAMQHALQQRAAREETLPDGENGAEVVPSATPTP